VKNTSKRQITIAMGTIGGCEKFLEKLNLLNLYKRIFKNKKMVVLQSYDLINNIELIKTLNL